LKNIEFFKAFFLAIIPVPKPLCPYRAHENQYFKISPGKTTGCEIYLCPYQNHFLNRIEPMVNPNRQLVEPQSSGVE